MMKKLWITILLTLSYFNANNAGITHTVVDINKPKTVKIKLNLPYNLDTLSYILGVKESSNNYKAINPTTYCLGKYQFKRTTLDLLNIKVTNKQFLNDSILQEQAFIKLVAWEYKFLKNHNILKFVGTKSVHGVLITTEGLIMSSHLCGTVSVYDYIVNRNTHTRIINWYGKKVKVYKTDANGTRIETYLRYNVKV